MTPSAGGAGRQEAAAGCARAVALLVFLLFVARPLGQWTRPAAEPIDCARVEAGDLTGLERCAHVEHDDVDLLLRLGAAHEAHGRWNEAEDAYRRSAAIDPLDGEVRVRLGRLLLRNGDAAAARREAAAAIALQPGRPAGPALLQEATAAEARR